MSGRVLRRPLLGWGFRTWWREVLAWLNLAFLFLCCWATGNVILAMLELVSDLVGG